MREGEYSMMGELQILLGVLTATVMQITNYWFSTGFPNKSEKYIEHQSIEASAHMDALG
jgi:hypothetical protein